MALLSIARLHRLAYAKYMKYIALLRGVNVGGNHRVPKVEFQAVLESLGFRDVVIYLNSGNS